MSWKAYEVSPIDMFWKFLPTLAVVRAKLKDMKHELPNDCVTQFNKDWSEAKALAKKIGWEGDVRGVVHIFWLPGDGWFEYGFVWKQDNNGTTFVVSPRELRHLLTLGSLPITNHSAE